MHCPADYQARPDLLAGRVILVTGAGSGIGKAAALSFAAHGATVVLLGRRVRALEQTYDTIRLAGGADPAIISIDLAQAGVADYDKVADTLMDAFGRLDGLLHNATHVGALTPLASYDPALWQHVLQVNLTAPFLLTRACLGLLQRGQDASVIFTTADVGRRGRAYWGAYAVSQFGLEGLMQTWADELSGLTRVRMNSLNPGAVDTRLRDQTHPAEERGKRARPDELMPCYLYLIGPDSVGTTGQQFDAQPLRS